MIFLGVAAVEARVRGSAGCVRRTGLPLISSYESFLFLLFSGAHPCLAQPPPPRPLPFAFSSTFPSASVQGGYFTCTFIFCTSLPLFFRFIYLIYLVVFSKVKETVVRREELNEDYTYGKRRKRLGVKNFFMLLGPLKIPLKSG